MKKRILMLSPVPTHPQDAGNRARIFQLAHLVRESGHDLYFAFIQRESGDLDAMRRFWGSDCFFSIPYTKPRKLTTRIRKKMMRMIKEENRYISYIDDWYDENIDGQLRRLYLKYQFDTVIVEYAFFSKALNCFPRKVLKIIDTHDTLSNRHKPFLDANQEYKWFSTTQKQEKKGLERADCILTIQDNENQFFSDLVSRKVVTVGHIVHTQKNNPSGPSGANLLFIGSANQSNVEALKLLLNEIFPKIRKRVPEASLIVAGPVCRILKEGIEGIVSMGIVDNINDVYQRADVAVNPIRLGTGLKIKNIESLGFSKPLVTTSAGAEGMEDGCGKAFLVEDEPVKFAESVVEILKNPERKSELSEIGYRYAISWNRKQQDTFRRLLEN